MYYFDRKDDSMDNKKSDIIIIGGKSGFTEIEIDLEDLKKHNLFKETNTQGDDCTHENNT